MLKFLFIATVLFGSISFSETAQEAQELEGYKLLSDENLHDSLTEIDLTKVFREHNADKIISTLQFELSSLAIDPRFIEKFHATIVERLYAEFLLERRHTMISHLLGRASSYFPLFDRYFASEKVPNEFKTISFIESYLRSAIKSGAGAAGLWQFMPGTARQYGIYRSDRYRYKGRWRNRVVLDARINILASTEAALKFIKWNLSRIRAKNISPRTEGLSLLVSYNAGLGRVYEAHDACSPNDLLFIDCGYDTLPLETRIYLLRFIAALYFLKLHGDFNIFPDHEEGMPECLTPKLIQVTRVTDAARVVEDDYQIPKGSFLNFNMQHLPGSKTYLVPHAMKTFVLFSETITSCRSKEEHRSVFVPLLPKIPIARIVSEREALPLQPLGVPTRERKKRRGK